MPEKRESLEGHEYETPDEPAELIALRIRLQHEKPELKGAVEDFASASRELGVVENYEETGLDSYPEHDVRQKNAYEASYQAELDLLRRLVV